MQERERERERDFETCATELVAKIKSWPETTELVAQTRFC